MPQHSGKSAKDFYISERSKIYEWVGNSFRISQPEEEREVKKK